MADRTLHSKWQSIVETAALVFVAAAVGWMAISKSTPDGSAPRTGPAARRPEPKLPSEPISLKDAQILGNRNAKVGLVVYSDFQCPFCGKFARETMPALDEQYVRPGKVLVAFRQFPLPNHEFAVKAAEGAECAGRQGKFWAFHDQLFANPQALDPASLHDHARRLGLDAKRFAGCLDGQATAVVQADKASGEPLEVFGTPTFLAGPILSDGRVKVSQRFSGAQPIAQFQSILDRLLGTAGAAPRGQD